MVKGVVIGPLLAAFLATMMGAPGWLVGGVFVATLVVVGLAIAGSGQSR